LTGDDEIAASHNAIVPLQGQVAVLECPNLGRPQASVQAQHEERIERRRSTLRRRDSFSRLSLDLCGCSPLSGFVSV
jgi:hypothetical protein